jgi:hypothetical protein
VEFVLKIDALANSMQTVSSVISTNGRNPKIPSYNKIRLCRSGWQIILKKAIGTRKNRKKHDNCGVTSKAEATIWVKPIK